MRIHYPKLRSMTHALSLSVFIAFKGTKFYIFIYRHSLSFHFKKRLRSINETENRYATEREWKKKNSSGQVIPLISRDE